MVALQEQVKKGVKILKAGGAVAFPTDTVYGLGADFSNFKFCLACRQAGIEIFNFSF